MSGPGDCVAAPPRTSTGLANLKEPGEITLRNTLVFIAAFSLLTLTSCEKQQAQQAPQKGPAGPPVMPVSVATAGSQSVPTEIRVIGTVEASAVVNVKSQIAGPLLKVAFTEGQNVQKGDLLFQI